MAIGLALGLCEEGTGESTAGAACFPAHAARSSMTRIPMEAFRITRYGSRARPFAFPG